MSKRKSSNKLDRPLPMTLEDHVKCANRIYIVSQEHRLLVADFHKKKCEEGRGKKQFKPRSKADNANYNDKYLELMKYCMGRLKGFCDNKKKRRWIKSMKRCVDL